MCWLMLNGSYGCTKIAMDLGLMADKMGEISLRKRGTDLLHLFEITSFSLKLRFWASVDEISLCACANRKLL